MDVVNPLTHAGPAAPAKGKPASGSEPGTGFNDALNAAQGASVKGAARRTPAQAETSAKDVDTDPREALLGRLDAAGLPGAARAGTRTDPETTGPREHSHGDDDADPTHAPQALAGAPYVASAIDAPDTADGAPPSSAPHPLAGPRAARADTARAAANTAAPSAAVAHAAGASTSAKPAGSDGPAVPPQRATESRALRHEIRQQAQAGAAALAATQDTNASRTATLANAAVLAVAGNDASHQATPAPVDGTNAPLTGLFGLAPTTHAGATTPAGAAAPTTPPTLQAPVGSTPWQQELGLQLVALTQRGGSHVELHLNPRDLGPLQISLTLDHQNAQAQFFAAHAVVRDAVQQAIPELRAALAGQGIALGEAMVGQQQQQQTGTGGFAQPAPWASPTGTGREIAGVQPVAITRVPLRVAPGAGVDLYA
ncbi:MAG TPA: flagellar hook-length control protein FliK [Rhodanobacteraceae bacterium]|nr:flagellar hook-length control protein FliK [Rhodanobacteraceae bacterium]